MAKRKKGSEKRSKQVRKSVTVDAAKLTKARQLLGASSDAEALRLALEYVLDHFESRHEEE
ncbi:MAG TPA: hypothetical protein VNK04_05995 [Gemmataceae bacterium]|nr:hypothetical protein [Gemmataceae bacterium]